MIQIINHPSCFTFTRIVVIVNSEPAPGDDLVTNRDSVFPKSDWVDMTADGEVEFYPKL